jgi:hydrogenase maturation protease
LAKLIILGVGNLLLRDEGAGIHAVNKLKEIICHPEIEIIDGGTLGLDLLGLLEDAERIWIIDCVRGGEKPGSVYKFGLDEVKKRTEGVKMSLHDFNLVDVLDLAQAIGKKLPEITFYGVEPESFELGLEPTAAVKSGIEKLVVMIVNDLQKYFGKEIFTKKGGG